MNYTSFFYDIARAQFNCATDNFKMMLVTSAYTPNKDTHTKRSDVTNEVSGTGYTAGGEATTGSVTQNNANDRVEIAFTDVVWPAATITARGAVIYRARGGAASADELVTYIDFGSDRTSTDGDFTADITSALFINNTP